MLPSQEAADDSAPANESEGQGRRRGARKRGAGAGDTRGAASTTHGALRRPLEVDSGERRLNPKRTHTERSPESSEYAARSFRFLIGSRGSVSDGRRKPSEGEFREPRITRKTEAEREINATPAVPGSQGRPCSKPTRVAPQTPSLWAPAASAWFAERLPAPGDPPGRRESRAASEKRRVKARPARHLLPWLAGDSALGAARPAPRAPTPSSARTK